MNQEQNHPQQHLQSSPLSYQDPATNATTPGDTPRQPNRKNYTWIYIAIIALLLGTNIYLFLNRNKAVEQRDFAVVQRDSVSMSRDVLQDEYDAAIARLDDLVSRNTNLTSQITDQNGEIAKLKQQINNILKNKNATDQQLSEARSLIARLNTSVRSYEDQIASLKTENKTLVTRNEQLAQERDSVSTERETLRKLGSVLHASNIRMIPIDLRRNGNKEKETSKAKRVDLMRIYFDIDENRIAESGEKQIFLRITGPDGLLLSNAAYGSGITTTEQGEKIGYTLAKSVYIEKDKTQQDVTVDWKQDSHFAKGTYLIELYNEGFRIGSGSVNLR